MSAAMQEAFSIIVGTEGGFSDRDKASDPGGATKYGITERVAREWGYKGEMRDLPLDTARTIFEAWYWKKYRCDELPPLIAFHVADAAYNGGYPVKWLQESIGVTADGIIGPKTIEAVKKSDQWKTIATFNSKRLTYMTNLANWPQNARGWAKRIANNISIWSI